jgi:hypothetical protein
MKHKKLFSFLFLLSLGYFLISSGAAIQRKPAEQTEEEKLLQSVHSISSHKLFDYVKELASDKYAGRLTGTEEYNATISMKVSLSPAQLLARAK